MPDDELGHDHIAEALRFHLKDEPGTLAKVTAALGDEGVSIHRMRQYGRDQESAPVLIVTHEPGRAALDRSLKAIAATDVSLAQPVAIRIEQA